VLQLGVDLPQQQWDTIILRADSQGLVRGAPRECDDASHELHLFGAMLWEALDVVERGLGLLH
jgi:hypothetical protein